MLDLLPWPVDSPGAPSLCYDAVTLSILVALKGLPNTEFLNPSGQRSNSVTLCFRGPETGGYRLLSS